MKHEKRRKHPMHPALHPESCPGINDTWAACGVVYEEDGAGAYDDGDSYHSTCPCPCHAVRPPQWPRQPQELPRQWLRLRLV